MSYTQARFALLADIHGNLVALDAVLDDIGRRGGVDEVWVLGDIVALGPAPVETLERLEAKDPRMAQVVNLRFFLGMTIAETGAALDRSQASIKRDWEFARLWLYHELQRRGPAADDDEAKEPVDGS